MEKRLGFTFILAHFTLSFNLVNSRRLHGAVTVSVSVFCLSPTMWQATTRLCVCVHVCVCVCARVSVCVCVCVCVYPCVAYITQAHLRS